MQEVVEKRRCSDCRKHKPLTDFDRNRTKKSGYQSNCKTCSRCASRRAMKRRANYQWLNQFKLEHGCLRCGYQRSAEALDMHHLRDKSFTISGQLHRSLERVKEEVAKCVVLCANCHRELHAGLFNISTLKPTTTRE